MTGWKCVKNYVEFGVGEIYRFPGEITPVLQSTVKKSSVQTSIGRSRKLAWAELNQTQSNWNWEWIN